MLLNSNRLTLWTTYVFSKNECSATVDDYEISPFSSSLAA